MKIKEITLKEFKDLEFKAQFSGKTININDYKIVEQPQKKASKIKKEITPDEQQELIGSLVKLQNALPELEGNLNVENQTLKVIEEMLTEAMLSSCSSNKLHSIKLAVDYLNKIYGL